MSCLYASDYGPPEPGFNPLADNGRLIKGFEDHAAVLARAANLGQLEAMQRVLRRNESITWCDQGYGWAEGDAVHILFAAILAFVVLPYAVFTLRARRRMQRAVSPVGLLSPSATLSTKASSDA
jgi:hypothetical protein